MAKPHARKQLWAWALYDFGNSAFATTVMAGFFPLFFKQYWSAGTPAAVSTLHLGAANSGANLLVALSSPLLGAIADKSGKKKQLLASYALLGAVMTGSLYFIGKGDWYAAALHYAVATVGFTGSLVFYDSLLIAVAAPGESDRASSFGYALGYLGGGGLFALNVAMALKPDWFGLADAAAGVRLSFLSVALWWAVFTLPLLIYVREPKSPELPAGAAIASGLAQLGRTLAHVRGRRALWLFLLAYWLYIDGVDTVVTMAVDYGLSLGLPASSLTAALLITQFVGFPAALAFGRLGDAIGTKRAVLLGLGVYLGITYFGYAMRTEREFFVLAFVLGLVQGGVQALSRALYSRLIPPSEAGEFFGFYNMLGKFAAILGPSMMGVVGVWTGSARLSILSLSVLFLAGATLLFLVDERGADVGARA
jgi:MFS transporter, UMF1 family